nr:thioredoxin [Cryptococcus depauperatus CBS 7855]
MVKAIESYNEWKSLINGSQVVVVEYWADWCGPCKFISPVFADCEERFPQLRFVKVDVDLQEQIAQEAQIKAMPVYTAYKYGTAIKSSVGAIPQQLKVSVVLNG